VGSSDQPQNNANNIKGLAFYHEIRWNLEFPMLKKRYWGRHFWTRGYFCATVGQMTDEMVQEYLAHHFEPDRPDNFRTES